MRKALVLSAVLGVSARLAGAAPTIDAESVSWTFDAHSRLVTVDYTLSGADDAIVTLDVLTNAVSVGAAATANATGDVFLRVSPGTHRIFWRPADLFATGGGDLADATFRVSAWSLDRPPAYLVVDLAVDSVQRVRYAVSEDALPCGGLASDVYRTSKVALRLIPAAGNTWTMGTTPSGTIREVPRIVTMTNDYYLGVFPVTQAQHLLVTGENPGTLANGLSAPVNNLSYITIRGSNDSYNWPNDGYAVADTSVLGLWRTRTAVSFDLPTSAQWEYACRAGAGTKFYWGETFSSDYAGESGVITPVGMKKPNAFGLYDMASCPWEWCLDWTGGLESAGSCVTEPIGPSACPTDDYSGGKPRRVGRGGGGTGGAYSAKVNPQVYNNSGSTYGYRLACPAALTR